MPTTLHFFVNNIDCLFVFVFFFFNDTATTEIYTLSLHDALPIYRHRDLSQSGNQADSAPTARADRDAARANRADRNESDGDRKSTRLNSSHLVISYAVFCLKKKKKKYAKLLHIPILKIDS